ncbi:hypothetical protein BDP27DRAFT_1413339 [Rhodocollybia butyracea]|uniref:Uncharacterized protein n=1 Tax=Rhodocollybia butyracea TaxID=206335 RepID=A0A9P5Q9W6_9AGAR|nr:hypothetical protein BDP27DRAFT_1413339 [Rhodocollybia butyracea]
MREQVLNQYTGIAQDGQTLYLYGEDGEEEIIPDGSEQPSDSKLDVGQASIPRRWASYPPLQRETNNLICNDPPPPSEPPPPLPPSPPLPALPPPPLPLNTKALSVHSQDDSDMDLSEDDD